MNFRSLIYWALSVFGAAYAAGRASASAPEMEAAMPASAFASFVTVPDTARSILLFVGILAVAFTYQRAWVNFRSGTAS